MHRLGYKVNENYRNTLNLDPYAMLPEKKVRIIRGKPCIERKRLSKFDVFMMDCARECTEGDYSGSDFERNEDGFSWGK